MRQAKVFVHHRLAGVLREEKMGHAYTFDYADDYRGPPVSLTMPTQQKNYHFDRFPAFFDGLLPEGVQLDGLLRTHKIDAQDYFSQLCQVGEDLVGAITVLEIA